jgi:hypothetical protein
MIHPAEQREDLALIPARHDQALAACVALCEMFMRVTSRGRAQFVMQQPLQPFFVKVHRDPHSIP